MRSLFSTVLIAVFVVVSGCSAENARESNDQKSSKINMELGVAYMQEGNYTTALDRLEKAKKLDPDNPIVYSYLGLLHARLGQNDDAEKHFEKAVQLAPGNSDIRNNYGAFLCKRKRYADAEKQFLEAVKNPLYRTPEYAYVNAGLCVENPERSEIYLRKALQLNPRFPLALYHMADLSFKKGRDMSARAYLQRYNDVAQYSPASLWLGIRIEHRLGDRITVRKWSNILKSKFPDTEETRLLLEMEQNDRTR